MQNRIFYRWRKSSSVNIGSCVILIFHVCEKRMLLSYTHLSVVFSLTNFRSLGKKRQIQPPPGNKLWKKHLLHKKIEKKQEANWTQKTHRAKVSFQSKRKVSENCTCENTVGWYIEGLSSIVSGFNLWHLDSWEL